MNIESPHEISLMHDKERTLSPSCSNQKHPEEARGTTSTSAMMGKVDGHLWNGQPFRYRESNLEDSFSSLDSDVSTITSASYGRDRKAKRKLPDGFRPTNYSVVFGRGAECFNATGNRRFRATAQLFLAEYSEAKTKLEKSAIVSKLVDLVRESSPEGAFIRYDRGCWWEVSDAVAREKVGAQLRDLLHTKYRSSTKAKLEKRKRATTEAKQKIIDLSSQEEQLLTSTVAAAAIEIPKFVVDGDEDSDPIALSEAIDPTILTRMSSLLTSFCSDIQDTSTTSSK